jgi:hypothetical protein
VGSCGQRQRRQPQLQPQRRFRPWRRQNQVLPVYEKFHFEVFLFELLVLRRLEHFIHKRLQFLWRKR